MARRLICKAALAALVGLSVVGLARADGNSAAPQPVVITITTQQPNQAAVVTGVSGVVVNGGETTALPRNHPVRDAIENLPHPVLNAIENHQPIGCWTHHNMFGCGSLRSETTFIFGSCRSFFGQSCLKEPPPDELAPMRDGKPDEAKPPRARLPFWFCPSCR